jgi:hypothetical protein
VVHRTGAVHAASASTPARRWRPRPQPNRLVQRLLVALRFVHGFVPVLLESLVLPELVCLVVPSEFLLPDVEVRGFSSIRVFDVVLVGLFAPVLRRLDVGVVLLAFFWLLLHFQTFYRGRLSFGAWRFRARADDGFDRAVAFVLGVERDVEVLGGALPVAAMQHLVDDTGRGVVARLHRGRLVLGLAPAADLLVAPVS